MGVPEIMDPLAQLSLPPGFRFYPTDEELLVQYLLRKVAGHHFDLQIIAEIDLYKCDPWVLPSKAIFGEKEWYFFSPRDRKYPNGSRPNRVAGSGYWKATGTDKIITTEGRKVGIKKSLVFYVGKAPKGTKTNWIMHEYRLIEPSRKKGSSKLDDWVLCRIYKKNSSSSQRSMLSPNMSSKEHSNGSCSSSSSHLDDITDSLTEIDNQVFSLPRTNSFKYMQNDDLKLNFQQQQQLNSGNFDWASLVGMNSSPELNPTQGPVCYNSGNDAYAVPTLTKLNHEVQSGLKTTMMPSQGHDSDFGQQSANFLLSHQSLANPIEQFGYGYPIQGSGFGLRQ